MSEVVNESGFEPTGDLVLVLPPKIETTTASGIAIPQSVIDKEQISCRVAVVIAMGEQAPLHPRMKGIEVGQKVLIPRYVQDRWVVGGDMYYILRAESVHGRVTKIPDYEMNAPVRAKEGPFGVNT